MMATLPSSKLKFEEAYPNDWDVFNAWPAGPVAVTREEAANGLRGPDAVGWCLPMERTATGWWA